MLTFKRKWARIILKQVHCLALFNRLSADTKKSQIKVRAYDGMQIDNSDILQQN
jgi:hypothetical protein